MLACCLNLCDSHKFWRNLYPEDDIFLLGDDLSARGIEKRVHPVRKQAHWLTNAAAIPHYNYKKKQKKHQEQRCLVVKLE